MAEEHLDSADCLKVAQDLSNVQIEEDSSDRNDDEKLPQIEDKSWSKATFIDGTAYWVDDDGVVGEEVDFGDIRWRYVTTGNNEMLLAPFEEEEVVPEVLVDGRSVEELMADGDLVQRTLARGDPKDPILNAVVDDMQRKWPELMGATQGSKHRNARMDREYIKHWTIRMFGDPDDPRHQRVMAKDSTGKLDYDFDNEDHELNFDSQRIGFGLLQLEEEQKKNGKKDWESFWKSMGTDDSDNEVEEQVEGRSGNNDSRLGRHIQRLIPKKAEGDKKGENGGYESDHSDTSVVSLTHCGPMDSYQDCDEFCWLRTPHDEADGSCYMPEPFTVTKQSPMNYTSLPPQSMRVLKLHPGNQNDPIVCSTNVRTTPMDDTVGQTAYEALSYTWGAQEKTHVVFCDDVEVGVTKNLHGALLHLRYESKERLIWVDAICINQEDIEERNNQVRQMLNIYKGASRVVIWLGDTEDDSSFAIAGMKYLDKAAQRRSIFQRTHTPICQATLARLFYSQRKLFDRPWFFRSWIRQEVSAAREAVIYCGKDTLPWFTFKRAANRHWKIAEKLSKEVDFEDDGRNSPNLEYLRSNWSVGMNITCASGDIRSVWYYHTGGLLDLLMAGRGFEATDPRDKIYASLGMAGIPIADDTFNNKNSVSNETMKIDYSSSVSEVYQHLAKYIINRDRNLDILSIICSHRDATSTGIPSWTPDWRVSTSSIPLLADQEYFTRKSHAGGRTDAIVQDQSDLGRLKVRGVYLASIDTLPGYSTAGLPQPPERPHAYITQFDPESDLRQMATLNISEDENDETQDACFVPRDARVGDQVWILYGSKFPMLLRDHDPADDTGNVYELIGPCFLFDYHWMMGGFVKYVKEEVEAEEDPAHDLVLI